MIDEIDKALDLLESLSAQVPMTAYPRTELLEKMQFHEEEIESNLVLQVDRIFYSAEQGGILCALRPWANSKKDYVVSITHLKFPKENPLWGEIRRYQKQRTIKLSVLEGRGRKGGKKSKNKRKGFGNFLKN